MDKLLSGVIVVLVMCVLGLCGANTGSAQGEIRTMKPQDKPLSTRDLRAHDSDNPAVVLTTEGSRPGTWTIVDTKAGPILLNTFSGETYLLRDAETSPRWVKVERPARVTWRLETVPQPKLVIPIEPHGWRGADEGGQGKMREEIVALEREAESLKARWAASGDRMQRRKLAEELERVEDKLEKLKAREPEGGKSRR